MAWQIAGERTIKSLLPALPGASTSLAMFASTDIGKLVQWSSAEVQLLTGSTANIGRVLAGILAGIHVAGTSAASTNPVYIERISAGERLEVDFSTASTDHPSTGSFLVTTNLGYVFAPNGFQSTGQGQTPIIAGFIDDTTARTTLAGSTVGFFILTDFSTDRRTVTGYIPSSYVL